MPLRAHAFAAALALLAASGCLKEGGGVLVQVNVDPGVKSGCVRVAVRPAAGGAEQHTAGMPRRDSLKVALYASETLGREVLVQARGYADCNESTLPDDRELSAPEQVTIPVSGTRTVTLTLERAVVPGDLDGDDYAGKAAGGTDCDDKDPATFPGAPEACGGTGLLDRDCDGKPGCEDEDCAGQPCGNDGGCVDKVCKGSLVEVCGDGKDNDADGDVDCLDDQCADQACDDGSACTQGERCGVNGAGVRACLPSTLPEKTVKCNSPPSPCFLGEGTCRPADGQCVYAVNPDKVDKACDDGQPCTVGDTCQANGDCAGTPRVCALPTGATWQCFGAGTCNPADGGCEYPVVPSNTCSDGDACTLGDHCAADGGCEPDSTVTCDAGPCQASACEKATGQCKATNRANGLVCDDGQKCTFGDVCKDGQCAGTPTVCDDSNGCTTDSCNPATGNCDHPFNSLPCDDGNPCTVGDVCLGGICTTAPKVCNDNNVCTTDSCITADGGCLFAPAAVTVKCTDNNACTGPDGDDFCNGSGGCLAGTQKNCPVPDAQCQVSTCDTATGNCSAVTNLANGTACTDNNKCTGTSGADSCLNGACTPGVQKSCPVTDAQCQVATCDANTGTCGKQNKQDGTLCTDNDKCTGLNGEDGCTNGACVPGTAKDCTTAEGIDCTVDSCNPADGSCSHVPDHGFCDGGNPCETYTCDPVQDCTVSFKANTAACSDSNACTAFDTCDGAGQCDGTPVTCDDSNPCTVDTCAAATGCAYTAVANDTVCTGGGCLNGTCVQKTFFGTGAGQLPSNFTPTNPLLLPAGPLTVSAGCTAVLNTGSLDGGTPPSFTGCAGSTSPAPTVRQLLQLDGATPTTVLSVTTLEVASTGVLNITGERPAIIAVYGDANIAGTVDASANMGTAGPGAALIAASASGAGACATGGGSASGGTGGANAGAGGNGGAGSTSGTPFVSGPTARTGAALDAVSPLLGGQPGGAGGSNEASGRPAGGGGGGGLQLSAAGKLTVSGTVAAVGGGGAAGTPRGGSSGASSSCGTNLAYGQGAGGGGSGGNVLLEATRVLFKSTARVLVGGGSGGEGSNNALAGKAGANGSKTDSTAAAGGSGSANKGGDGGEGGSGTTATSATAAAANANTGGSDYAGGGGGGGGAGRVRVNALVPTAQLNVNTHLCRETGHIVSPSFGSASTSQMTPGFTCNFTGAASGTLAASGAAGTCL